MKNSKFILFSLTLLFFFSVSVLAQDGKIQTDKNKKIETIREADKKSDNKTSCCGTEAPAATVKAWNSVCPVMGNKIDASVKTVEYDGKLYGFCCDGCDDKFAKDPARYSRNLSKDGTKFTKARS